MKEIEQVLCVPDWQLINIPLGFTTGFEICRKIHYCIPGGQFNPRDIMENDASYRQIIPYIVVHHLYHNQILRMTRKKKQTETRLHNRTYIGIGGHINPIDMEGDILDFETVFSAAARELKEEVGLTAEYLNLMGVIKTSGNDVERVHLGVVFHCITSDSAIFDDEEMHDPEWVSIDQIKADENLEGWSKLIAEKL